MSEIDLKVEENLAIPNDVFADIMERVGVPKEQLLDYLIKGMPNLSEEGKVAIRSEIQRWKEKQEDCLVKLVESARDDIKEGRSYSVEEALTKLKNSRNNQGE